jgi:hypothetical protein
MRSLSVQQMGESPTLERDPLFVAAKPLVRVAVSRSRVRRDGRSGSNWGTPLLGQSGDR